MKLAIGIAGDPRRGFQAWCPALPGCTVFGATEDEARSRIRDAIAGYLANLDVAPPRDSRELELHGAANVA